MRVCAPKRGYAHLCVVFGRPRVCMCTGVWMGDNKGTALGNVRGGEEMRMVLLVGPRFYKQAPV